MSKESPLLVHPQGRDGESTVVSGGVQCLRPGRTAREAQAPHDRRHRRRRTQLIVIAIIAKNAITAEIAFRFWQSWQVRRLRLFFQDHSV